MSSVNWPEILAILVGFAAFFIYLMSRMDSSNKALNDEIRAGNKILNANVESCKKELKMEIRDLDKKIELRR